MIYELKAGGVDERRLVGAKLEKLAEGDGTWRSSCRFVCYWWFGHAMWFLCLEVILFTLFNCDGWALNLLKNGRLFTTSCCELGLPTCHFSVLVEVGHFY